MIMNIRMDEYFWYFALLLGTFSLCGLLFFIFRTVQRVIWEFVALLCLVLEEILFGLRLRLPFFYPWDFRICREIAAYP